MVMMIRGSHMGAHLQAQVKAAYPHRYTRDHVPEWAKDLRPCGRPYPVQFKDDAEWLANTFFPITKKAPFPVAPVNANHTPPGRMVGTESRYRKSLSEKPIPIGFSN